MGREGRAADNWGAFFKPKREMILQVVSETERWGGGRPSQSAWRAG